MESKETTADSDLEYDPLTTLHNRAAVIKAYETQIKDAENWDSQPCANSFRKLKEAEAQQVYELQHPQRVMQSREM